MALDQATLCRAHERFLKKQRLLDWKDLIVLLRKLDEDELEAMADCYRLGDEKRMGEFLIDYIDLCLWESALLETRAEVAAKARATQST